MPPAAPAALEGLCGWASAESSVRAPLTLTGLVSQRWTRASSQVTAAGPTFFPRCCLPAFQVSYSKCSSCLGGTLICVSHDRIEKKNRGQQQQQQGSMHLSLWVSLNVCQGAARSAALSNPTPTAPEVHSSQRLKMSHLQSSRPSHPFWLFDSSLIPASPGAGLHRRLRPAWAGPCLLSPVLPIQLLPRALHRTIAVPGGAVLTRIPVRRLRCLGGGSRGGLAGAAGLGRRCRRRRGPRRLQLQQLLLGGLVVGLQLLEGGLGVLPRLLLCRCKQGVRGGVSTRGAR